MEKFAEKLLALRKAHFLSRSQLSAETGLSIHSLQRYELGRQMPPCTALAELARFYQVPADYLLFDDMDDPCVEVDLSPLAPRDRRTVRELAQILLNDYCDRKNRE